MWRQLSQALMQGVTRQGPSNGYLNRSACLSSLSKLSSSLSDRSSTHQSYSRSSQASRRRSSQFDFSLSPRREQETSREYSVAMDYSNGSPSYQRQARRRRLRRVQAREPAEPKEKDSTAPSYLVPISARHVAQTIDLFPILSRVFTARNASRNHKMFGKNSFVVELHPVNARKRFVAVFRYGSIVGMNVSPRDMHDIIQEIKKHHLVEPTLSGFERKENFSVMLDPGMEEPDQFTVLGDYCVVPELDMNVVAVISNIMAQTVALDSFNDTVDGLLANFAEINAAVTKSGNFRDAKAKEFLFRSIAQNNSIFIDMISKVRLKERSETAWNLTKYEDIHYGLKEEFEIDDRFDQIEFKLNLIQQNAKFFLEMLHHQKSSSLEWTIVVLILLECFLMCVEMSGNGEAFFQAIL